MRLLRSAVVAALLCHPGATAPAAASEGSAWQAYGAGVNVLSDDPVWTDPAKARFHWDLFRTIRAAGFRHVRVALQAFAHMDAADRLDPTWLATLDTVVAQATAAGLDVILDEHDYHSCGADPDTCRRRLLAFWRQVAPRYRDAPAGVLFEILNEPNRGLDAARWNSLLAETLVEIRRSNPTRTVVVGPADSNSMTSLPQLVLPGGDRHLLVTIHYYRPFPFTHQGATWTTPSREHLLGVAWGSPADHVAVEADFDAIASWARANGRPILVGEFGAYEKGAVAMRRDWAATVARAAEQRGFAWTWWQFAGSFALFDIASGQWNAPLATALMPRRQ